MAALIIRNQKAKIINSVQYIQGMPRSIVQRLSAANLFSMEISHLLVAYLLFNLYTSLLENSQAPPSNTGVSLHPTCQTFEMDLQTYSLIHDLPATLHPEFTENSR